MQQTLQWGLLLLAASWREGSSHTIQEESLHQDSSWQQVATVSSIHPRMRPTGGHSIIQTRLCLTR